ncbi:hypothetical protein L1987_53788 [Smallanthus sonchifolius]|uniref:Uncharacterized protein n=1 Tax=Smallanthus sonchifolius TaxID=185202 RepID=A0ACB9EWK0_9ASTR|nr:hypothetical protein L1987_53788 [Smallanthus sonchifolius]
MKASPISVASLSVCPPPVISESVFRCMEAYGSPSLMDASKSSALRNLTSAIFRGWKWEALNAKIGRWIRAAKVCIRVLFASEKNLCKQIFKDEEEVGVKDEEEDGGAYYTEQQVAQIWSENGGILPWNMQVL